MGSLFSVSSIGGGIVAIALVLAVIATVLAFIFIVPEKKKAKLGKFGKFLHDTVNFKYLIVEKILQALYIFLTAYVELFGFLMLFYVQKPLFGGLGQWFGGYGILIMIFGPIVVRLFYELFMMAVLLVKNVMSINNKLKNQNDSAVNGDVFASPDFSTIKNAFMKSEDREQNNMQGDHTAYAYCKKCGNPVEKDAYCSKCGTKSE